MDWVNHKWWNTWLRSRLLSFVFHWWVNRYQEFRKWTKTTPEPWTYLLDHEMDGLWTDRRSSSFRDGPWSDPTRWSTSAQQCVSRVTLEFENLTAEAGRCRSSDFSTSTRIMLPAIVYRLRFQESSRPTARGGGTYSALSNTGFFRIFFFMVFENFFRINDD